MHKSLRLLFCTPGSMYCLGTTYLHKAVCSWACSACPCSASHCLNHSLYTGWVCRVAVLNDFEACGYGVPVLKESDVLVLNDVPARQQVYADLACLHPVLKAVQRQ